MPRRHPAGPRSSSRASRLEAIGPAIAELGADVVLLDNMGPETMRPIVEGTPGMIFEASGGVNLETIRAITATGVQLISVGALTHSAPSLDIALDVRPE